MVQVAPSIAKFVLKAAERENMEALYQEIKGERKIDMYQTKLLQNNQKIHNVEYIMMVLLK